MSINLDDLPKPVVAAMRDYDFQAARIELAATDLDAQTKERFGAFVDAIERRFRRRINQLKDELAQPPQPGMPQVIILCNPGAQLLPPESAQQAA